MTSDVAIIGGGFSGTMVAAQLARRGIRSILIEGNGRMGRGIAYSTREPAHVLNVRAEVMSAWPDDLEDFARAAVIEGGSSQDYSERMRFGRYLRGILDRAVAEGLVEPVEAMAVSAAREADGWSIGLDDGSKLAARALVLAIGNQEPAPMAVSQGISAERFISNPWGPEAKAAVERLAETDGNVLLLGTGLTAVDLILSLHANVHRGTITALSRRGQLPRGHAPFEPAAVERDDVPPGNVLQLWRWLRRRAAQGSWRAAVDSLRPHSSAIWQGFGEAEQRRFMRHARPWWDVHRHRIAPEVAGRIRQLVQEGRLHIVAGRVKAMSERNGQLSVAIQRRGMNDSKSVNFGLAVNCTGPLGSISESDDPLLGSLFDGGHARPDSLDLGLEVDGRSRIAGAKRAWALGPLTKGRFWEITAVPDIRGQVASVADDIAEELKR